MTIDHAGRRDISHATVSRLPIYLRVARERGAAGVRTISSDELAERAGVSPAQLRKDLSTLGSYGTRGVGYDIEVLTENITRALGLQQPWGVAIVGMGNLGTALATYGGIAVKGFDVKWLIDDDPNIVGRVIGGVVVQPFEALESADVGRAIGVIAVPAIAAQQVADRLVGVGVRSILNFAPTVLTVPNDVQVRALDMASELQILAFREQYSRSDAEISEMKELMA